MTKRLYRSRESKVIGGVCGGLGEYFDVDPVLVRIITVILAFGPGLGVLAYIIAWIIIPERPLDVVRVKSESRPTSWHKYLPGLVLMGIGVLLLVREHWFWFGWDEFWPVALIAIGLALIAKRGKSRDEVDQGMADSPNSSPHTNNGEGQI
ncbi:MAG: PspC domain-containing protein [bacterium]